MTIIVLKTIAFILVTVGLVLGILGWVISAGGTYEPHDFE